jgi:Flp pilus assembly pilin Flp
MAYAVRSIADGTPRPGWKETEMRRSLNDLGALIMGERGVTALEYSLIAVLIVTSVGTVGTTFQTIAAALP